MLLLCHYHVVPLCHLAIAFISISIFIFCQTVGSVCNIALVTTTAVFVCAFIAELLVAVAAAAVRLCWHCLLGLWRCLCCRCRSSG